MARGRSIVFWIFAVGWTVLLYVGIFRSLPPDYSVCTHQGEKEQRDR